MSYITEKRTNQVLIIKKLFFKFRMFLKILAVFVNTDGKERQNNDEYAEVTAVAVTEFDDVAETYHRNRHGKEHNACGNDYSANDRFLNFLKRFDVFETGNEAEYGSNAG